MWRLLKIITHIEHNKKILLKFQPNENELKVIADSFKYYDKKIENLLKEKFHKIKELKDKDKINIEKEKSDNNNNYDTNIENLKNLKRLKKIIYNTYNIYDNNYFNSINVNSMLIRKENNKIDFNNDDNIIKKNPEVKNKYGNKILKKCI